MYKKSKGETPKTAVIYVRVSSKEQTEGYSLDSQEKVCREYATRNQLQVLKIFKEQGESAKTADRTELKNLIRYCEKNRGKVGFMVVYKLDRFARNQEDHFAIKIILKKYGVTVVSATEPITGDPAGQMLEGVLAALAQFDNAVRAQRTSEGMRAALRSGHWPFKANFGYLNTKDVAGSKIIAPNPKHVTYVKFLFEEYAKGIYTFRELSRKANKLDPASKVKVSPQLVVKILTNPLYAGFIEVPTWEVSTKGVHEPIVSQELFEKARYIMRGGNPNKVIRNRDNPDFPLRGVKCSICGHSVTGGWTTGKTGKRYPYYNCGNVDRAHRQCISREKFNNDFTDLLSKLTPREKDLKVFRDAVIHAYHLEVGAVTEQNKKVELEIRKLTDQRQRLMDVLLKGDGLISEDDFKEQRGKIDERIKELQLATASMEDEDLDIERAAEFAIGFIKNLPQQWKALDVTDLKVLRGILFPQNIVYHYPGFQTPEVCPIYALNQMSSVKKETVVAPGGIEPPLPH